MLTTALVVWIFVASGIAGCLYWWDKRASIKNRRRVSERTLLIWSALGGWPGALIVGRSIRHKTSKLTYRIPFTLCMIGHLIAVTLYLSWRFGFWNS